MTDDRIRIRCEKSDRSRWRKICEDHNVDEPQIHTLRALMDVYEGAPNALHAVEGEYIDPDDQIVIYPDPKTAQRFRYWCRHFDSPAAALQELLDLTENTPEDVPTLDV